GGSILLSHTRAPLTGTRDDCSFLHAHSPRPVCSAKYPRLRRTCRVVKTPRTPSLHQAFDEIRFGADRTLNLRTHHPSRKQALRRAENWLRERQMSRAGEALVITGRGNNSPDGVSVVRTAILQLFASLRRRGVISDFVEHTPGSFVVTFAKLNAVRDAPQRARNPHELPPQDPAQLA